jgi:hypothetical protein
MMMRPRSEDELTLLSARSCVDEVGAERIQTLLGEGINWASFIVSVGRQAVLPLVYKTLKTRFPNAIPEQVFNQLRTRYATNLGRNILLTRELLRIVDLLQAHGVRALPVKGPSLAVFAYGDLGLRSFGDLDVLVQRSDVERVRAALTAEGFFPVLELPREEEPRFLRFHFERAFGHADRPLLLEIHWALDYPCFSFAAAPERLWDRCATLTVEGKPIPSLAPEDLLIYLCAHGARHRWQRLAWICDVAELIRTCRSLRWGDIVTRAEKSGSARMLALGLFLAYDLLGAVLPHEVVERVTRDGVVQVLAGEVKESLFMEPELLLDGGDPEVNFFFIRTMLRLGDKVKGFLTDIMVPNAFELGLLPSRTFVFPLYFLVRPIRLMGKTMKTALTRFL